MANFIGNVLAFLFFVIVILIVYHWIRSIFKGVSKAYDIKEEAYKSGDPTKIMMAEKLNRDIKSGKVSAYKLGLYSDDD